MLHFFENLPADNGIAFVIVLHLAPDHPSSLDQILQAATAMPVIQVTHPIPIEKNRVYVIAPSFELTMSDGMLRVTPGNRPPGRHTAIDLFFRTLEEAHRERAISIILSGAGSDGSVGLTRVKELGGITLAQAPADAIQDSMPRSAIATGKVDIVLPAAELAQKLVELRENARGIRLPLPDTAELPDPADDEARNAEKTLREIMIMLRTRTGHDFRHYKRATVLRRIERRLQVNGLQTLQAYRDFLQVHPDETPALLQDMLISVTNFFRDKEAFDALEKDVLPSLFRSREETSVVRAWVAGCATGEEAYSVAMMLEEAASQSADHASFQVFATDIDEYAIGAARTALFPDSIAADVSPIRLRQFFQKEQSQFRVKKELREKVLFALHNVLSDPPFSRLDLVCCRNLLIYLDRDAQTEILRMFHFALHPGGYLFLGSSESADSVGGLFTAVDKKNRIYRANVAIRTELPLPASPLSYNGRRPIVTTVQPPGKRKFSFGELHQRLLEQYAPPSVLVNRESEIVHLSDRAGRFLQYAGGEPSHNIISVIRPELRLELRTAIYQALQFNRSVEARRVRLMRDGRPFYVNMTTRPVHDPESGADFLLVLFDEVEDTMSLDLATPEGDKKDAVVTQLEQELSRVKEQLQATIEQSEASTEELKASNEELQAINEELRSATEELETSKEELQSINEELTTVNAELKAKVEETGKINDDLQNLITANDIGTIFVDRSMRIKRFTPRAAEVFSIIASDVGRSLLDITHRLEYDDLAVDAAEAFDSLRLIEREVRSTDGRWFLARLLPYRTTEDRIDGAVLTFIDVTARREAEDRLREGERRLRLVAESTHDYAIITLDDEGRIDSWNTGAERIFGFTEQEAVGQAGEILFTERDRRNGVFQEELRTARAEGRCEEERWMARKDGGIFQCSGVLIRLDRHGVAGYAKIARDLSSSAMHAARAAGLPESDHTDEAHRMSQAKEEFLAVVSHELKHPLNLIYANAELLVRSPESARFPAIARAADTIRRTVLGQAQIIDDLLDLSRIRTGKLAVVRSPMDWKVIVDRICAALSEQARNDGIELTVTLPETPVMIDADPVRIEQIVWNLLSNALKFTPAGGRVDVTLRVDGPMATLDVTDSGAGIAPDFLPYVFDMFRQAPRNLPHKGGLGIGLSLVRQIVALHGGQVSANSAGLGQGSSFEVSLPLRREAVGEISAHAPAAWPTVAGLAVLLVDDDPQTCEAFSELFSAEGCRVLIATRGEEALRALADGRVDVLLSDLGMPEMDGFELIGRVRRMALARQPIAIALSGYGRETDVAKAREAGFDAHLGKPIVFDQLIELIGRLRAG
ncbi:hypothetical protein GCM10023144_38200 [Pigmentiphaga soli]|uniref:PAS domain S-box protein n=1 Tax=Pigmentiphaga soli TaxID=1007095 RepID=A0ABP8HI64_9BURK